MTLRAVTGAVVIGDFSPPVLVAFLGLWHVAMAAVAGAACA